MPSRILKESICSSESLNRLKPFHETFFYRLIVNCDDFGRMDARPAILKAKLFPLKERLTLREINDAVRALADVGCVEIYEVDGKPYLYLPSWESHQQKRAKNSKYPSPDKNPYQNLGNLQHDIICNQMISDDIKCPREANTRNEKRETNTRNESKDTAPAAPTSAPGKKGYGQYGWVKLSEEQYRKLEADLGEAELMRCIRYIDESAQLTGNKNRWKDWNLTIRKCSREGWGKKRQEGEWNRLD